jgi:hypothetical protein
MHHPGSTKLFCPVHKGSIAMIDYDSGNGSERALRYLSCKASGSCAHGSLHIAAHGFVSGCTRLQLHGGRALCNDIAGRLSAQQELAMEDTFQLGSQSATALNR